MDILVASDLHTEFMTEKEQVKLVSSFPKTEVIVLAGDICGIKNAHSVLGMFCDKYENVVYVCGNHEYYRSSFAEMDECVASITHSNFHWLERTRKEIKGHSFIGATMWFPYTYYVDFHRSDFNDFVRIENYSDIFVRCEETLKYFKENMKRNDIVITHHLPVFLSVDKRYKGSTMNSFFVAPADEIIVEKQPKIWIHGHTHSSCDYHIDGTRVVCNPLGYKREINPVFKHLILSVH